MTVFCVDSFTRASFAEFAGSLTFTTPTSYHSGAVPVPPSVAPPGESALAGKPAAAAEPATGARLPLGRIALVVALVLGAFEAGRRLGRHTATSSTTRRT